MAKRPKVRCLHRHLFVLTERDRCSWVVCCGCGKTSPRKHSYALAMLAFLVKIGDQHPRKK
jgi:hypothetical protein